MVSDSQACLSAESGLYFLRARYYDSSTGQFISRDPLTATTRAPYSYTGDNPLNATDPSGLLWTGMCLGWNAGFLLGGSESDCLGVVTRHGGSGFDPLNDIALTHTYGGGLQTPYAGGGGGIEVSNADYTDEQGGLFGCVGAGFRALGGANVNGFHGFGRGGRHIVGADLSAGPGIGEDLHGGVTNTDVITPQNVVDGYNNVVHAAQGAWNTLTHLW